MKLAKTESCGHYILRCLLLDEVPRARVLVEPEFVSPAPAVPAAFPVLVVWLSVELPVVPDVVPVPCVPVGFPPPVVWSKVLPLVPVVPVVPVPVELPGVPVLPVPCVPV